VLGGADAVLLGGGAAEHLGALRARLFEGMGWCGVVLDEAANAAARTGGPAALHAAKSTCEIWVLPVDEERILHDDALAVLAREGEAQS